MLMDFVEDLLRREHVLAADAIPGRLITPIARGQQRAP